MTRAALVRLGLLAVLALLGAFAWLGWGRVDRPVRAAVRDYLAYRRVEKFEDVLRVV